LEQLGLIWDLRGVPKHVLMFGIETSRSNNLS
jgi:hypothetical protein